MSPQGSCEPSPADDYGDLAHEMGVAVAIMTEFASVDPSELADKIIKELRERGVVLYDHDDAVVRAAVGATYDSMAEAILLAIDLED